MKKLVILFLWATLLVSTAYAEEIKVIDRHLFHKHINKINVHDKTVDTDTHKGNEYGVGTDVIVWEDETDNNVIRNLKTEYRYDIDNRDHKVYGVFTLNIWKSIKKVLDK